MLKLITTKILVGNEVFVPCASFLEDCPLSKDELNQKYHCITQDGFGLCISEQEFNQLLEEYPDMPYNKQITRVDSLEVRAKNIIRTYPLKQIFAKDMLQQKAKLWGMDIDEYIANVDYPLEIEREKISMADRAKYEDDLQRYQQKTEELKTLIPLDKFGLEIQQMTIISDKVEELTFLAGTGIFYQVYLDFMDDWSNSTEDTDGTIRVPDDDYANGMLMLKRTQKRDFRKFDVLDNILYCIQNIRADNEWVEYMDIRGDGIKVDLPLSFIMRLLNPTNCSEQIWINGIPKINQENKKVVIE